ncbi:hypothetical protein ES332_D12G262200v1 [Gossypium tomentosum]|uniref:Uncharacterized protein n=1 Tax=Gossypium tomentosum TaxID=34277 RepID=A0A5D2IFE1_GOSTO|nr:hypothetical protein ES332_D12G262200v1 [Gossypium tomentosum]
MPYTAAGKLKIFPFYSDALLWLPRALRCRRKRR